MRIHSESGKEATLCHSNPQKHEESVQLLQGIVTYMSRVAALVTGIKIESSDQTPFWRLIKGSRFAKINGSRTHSYNLTFDSLKIYSGALRTGSMAFEARLWQNLDQLYAK